MKARQAKKILRRHMWDITQYRLETLNAAMDVGDRLEYRHRIRVSNWGGRFGRWDYLSTPEWTARYIRSQYRSRDKRWQEG